MPELFEQQLVTTILDDDRIALGQTTAGTYKNIKWSALKTLITTINWVFSVNISVPTPTTSLHATNKTYVDTLDNANMKKTAGTAQTCARDTTFQGYVRGVLPTNAADLTRKDYVDTLDSANVKITGTQNISGEKSFVDNATTFEVGINILSGRTPTDSNDTDPNDPNIWCDDDYIYFYSNGGVLKRIDASTF